METGLVKLNPELMALISGKDAATSIAPFQREVFLVKLPVKGTGYCKRIKKEQRGLVPGMELTLRRHPDNEYDDCAVGIYSGERRVGWIPMVHNQIIAHLMDIGKRFICKIDSIVHDDDWPKIEVNIYIVD